MTKQTVAPETPTVDLKTPTVTPEDPVAANMANANMSIYEQHAHYERLKMKGDLIYRVFMQKDTTELNQLLQAMIDIVTKKYPNLSDRFHTYVKRTISEDKADVRCAKHALLLFGMSMTPEFVTSLVADDPQIPPEKMKQFFENRLPGLCDQLLNGIFSSMQEFIENVRIEYVKT